MSVTVWKGIRYARAPHRFAAPMPEPLSDRPAPGGKFGPAPWQQEIDEFPLGVPQSDDCLSLNIWAPENARDLPVVFWLYGGGFEMGAASVELLDGAHLASHIPAVVVAPNYRLGAFGFAELARFGGRLSDASNLGLQDALCAYRWVHEHISLFGGDNRRITVAGQSAGGFLGCALAAAPQCPKPAALACLSGGASRIIPRESTMKIADALLDELGISDDPEQIIDADPLRVIAAQGDVIPKDLGLRNGPRPWAFGVAQEPPGHNGVVPQHPMDSIAAGALSSTFILSSSTTWELVGFDADAAGEQSGDAVVDIRTFAADLAPRVLPEYLGTSEGSGRRHARVLTDYIYRLPAARLVEAQRAAGGRAALLEISTEQDAEAGHGCDLGAIFSPSSDSSRDAKISEVFATLVRDNSITGGAVNAPIIAGDDDRGGAFPSDQLLSTWKGIERP